jgi:hypothetical protein
MGPMGFCGRGGANRWARLTRRDTAGNAAVVVEGRKGPGKGSFLPFKKAPLHTNYCAGAAAGLDAGFISLALSTATLSCTLSM